MLGKWFPPTEKSSASSITQTGGAVGGLLAIGAGPVLASTFGWRAALVGAGSISLLFTAFWGVSACDRPGSCSRVSAGEMRYLESQGVSVSADKAKAARAIPWHLFRSPAAYAVCYAHAVYNFGRYFLYAWIPTYYMEVMGTSAYFAGACMTTLQVCCPA